MSGTINRESVTNALEAADIFDHDQAIREDFQEYNYNRPGFGIVLNNPLSLFTFFTALGIEAGENYADGAEDCLEDGTVFDLAAAARQSSMGLDTIVYFPGWTLSE
jgi:hypothetical protein